MPQEQRLAFTVIACGGREAVRVDVAVRVGTTEHAQALATAVLADLPVPVVRANIQGRLPRAHWTV